MKNRLASLVGLSLLVIGPLTEALAEPQRGSRGSSGASASASRGSGGGRGSSMGSRGSSMGSRGSQSSRPSGGGSFSRPSSSPSRGSSTTVRPSSSSGRSSSPPSVSPSQGLSGSGSTRSVLPSRPPSRTDLSGATRSVLPSGTPATGAPSSGAPAVDPSGRQLYTDRVLPGSPPAAGGGVTPDAGTPGLSIPPARTQPRVRFPAPYSPAGDVGRTLGTRGSGASPSPRSVSPNSLRGGNTAVPGTPAPGGKAPGTRGSSGKRDSGPAVRYDRGPTRRVDGPVVATPTSGGAKPSAPASGAKGGKSGKSTKASDLSKTSKSVTSWGDVRRSDPKKAKEITAATKAIGRVQDTAVGVVAGAVGGVNPGGYRSGCDLDDDWACDPCGWSGWSFSCSFWGGWSWWSYPCYWSWYYPAWWWCTWPYYYTDYCYYPAVSTVIYSEPQVVYVESEPEPVGEAVVAAPAQPAAQAPVPENPLSIAAQRYLDLGDRAFREGRYTDAVQFYAKAVEFAPDQGALYLVLADALFAAGDYHYGAYAIRRALELDPGLLESQIDKHGFYQDPAIFDQQLATLERYLDDHAGDRDARLVLALNYLFGGRPTDAVRAIESSAAAMADDQAAQRILARASQLSQG